MRRKRTVYEWSKIMTRCNFCLGLLYDNGRYYPKSRESRLRVLENIAFKAIWLISKIDLNDKKFKG